MKTWVIAAAHKKDFNIKLANHLLESSCKCLGLEYPTTCQGLIREYVTGRMGYSNLMCALGPKCVPNYNSNDFREVSEREKPIFDAIRKLKSSYKQFNVFTFDHPNLFLKEAALADMFYDEVLSNSPDIGNILRIYDAMVSVQGSRNRMISRLISRVAKSTSDDVYVSVGAVHAPFITLELKGKRLSAEVCLLEDFPVPPKDELIIRRHKGETINRSEMSDYATRDLYFWNTCAACRETGKQGLTTVEFVQELKLKTLSQLYADLDI